MRPLTIIFDRSAFHGPAFDRLAQSPLAQLARAGKLLVHHTPVFLEETLAMYEKERHRVALQRQIEFILGVCNGDWFRPPDEIYRQELLRKRSRRSLLIQTEIRADVERRVRYGVFSKPVWPQFEAAQTERNLERTKRVRQREILVEMRGKVVEELAKLPASVAREQTPWQVVRERELNYVGSQIIELRMAFRHSEQIARAWCADKERYPYFTSFAEGFLYIRYCATAKSNMRIDRNAQADIQQLSYLHSADCIVANDTRFMKDAFDTLWKPKGKLFFTTDAFVGYIQQIA